MIDSQDIRTLPLAIERLSAPGPFAPAKNELMLYGRLIGAWDIDWVAFDESGDAVERRSGEWHFAWVLGGRGAQDVISGRRVRRPSRTVRPCVAGTRNSAPGASCSCRPATGSS